MSLNVTIFNNNTTTKKPEILMATGNGVAINGEMTYVTLATFSANVLPA